LYAIGGAIEISGEYQNSAIGDIQIDVIPRHPSILKGGINIGLERFENIARFIPDIERKRYLPSWIGWIGGRIKWPPEIKGETR